MYENLIFQGDWSPEDTSIKNQLELVRESHQLYSEDLKNVTNQYQKLQQDYTEDV